MASLRKTTAVRGEILEPCFCLDLSIKFKDSPVKGGTNLGFMGSIVFLFPNELKRTKQSVLSFLKNSSYFGQLLTSHLFVN